MMSGATHKREGIAIPFGENGLSTEGWMGKMMIQIFATAAEAERECILQRTDAVRLAAMATGVKYGRKPHQKSIIARNVIAQKFSAKVVMEETGIFRATDFRLVKTGNASNQLNLMYNTRF